MGLRRIGRQRVLQMLYSVEVGGKSFDDAREDFLSTNARNRRHWNEFTERLSRETWERRRELDKEIEPALKNWKLNRIPKLDRIGLRMALCEFKYFDEVPSRVTIDEYVEMAKLFGEDESPQYINGVLDTLAKSYPAKDFQLGKNGAPPKQPAEIEAAVAPEEEHPS